MLLAGLLSFVMLTAVAQRGPQGEDAVSGATPMPEAPMPGPDGHHGCHAMGPGCQPVDFQSVKICYVPQKQAFLAVDSVECTVHLVKMMDDGMLDTVVSYKTDNTYKRHDLKNILRPVSVGVMGDLYVVLASAVNDSAYVVLLDEQFGEVSRRDFSSPMYAMHMELGRMIVVGRNPYGYDINIIPVCGDPMGFAEMPVITHHYRVAKQSEKIKNSDPVGIGLTAVAVAVVFLALVCIALLIGFSGKIITNSEKRQKEKGEAKKERAIKPVAAGGNNEDELYAAIAAAIHLYNDELHDEETAVITIQKVEREWTPWNAKFYNMNQYFNNRR